MALCETCVETGMTTCMAQGLWERSEEKFNSAVRKIEKDWEARGKDPALKLAHDAAINQLVEQRAAGADNIRSEAAKLGCTELKILPFAE